MKSRAGYIKMILSLIWKMVMHWYSPMVLIFTLSKFYHRKMWMYLWLHLKALATLSEGCMWMARVFPVYWLWSRIIPVKPGNWVWPMPVVLVVPGPVLLIRLLRRRLKPIFLENRLYSAVGLLP